MIFTEKLLSSRYIAKANIGPVSSSIILLSALTDLLIKKKKKRVLIYILSNLPPIKGSPEKDPLEMRNRKEMRKNVPGKCASWNVRVMCPEIPVYQEACITWKPKEANVDLGTAVATCP